jgi:hypothetical protein
MLDLSARDLTTNVLGGLITAFLLYLLGRTFAVQSSRMEAGSLRDLGIEMAETPGPVLRRPILVVVLSSVFAASLMFVLDFVFPPLGLAKFLDQTALGMFRLNREYNDFRGEAEALTARNDAETKNTLQQVQSDAFSLMDRAAELEKRLRSAGQSAAADSVIALAESQARMLQEETKRRIERNDKELDERRSRLMHDYDEERRAARGVRGYIGAALTNFTDWCARFLIVSVLASIALRRWGMPRPSFSAGMALAMAAMVIGTLKVFMPLGVFDLIFPLYAAALIYAGSRRELRPAQLLVGGLGVLYERSGRALIVVAATAATALLTSWLVYGVLTSWWIEDVSGDIDVICLLGGMFGFEFGRALGAPAFLSIAAGPLKNSPRKPPVSEAARPLPPSHSGPPSGEIRRLSVTR